MNKKQVVTQHLGQRIYQYSKDNRRVLSATARHLGMREQSYHDLLKRPTMQVERLQQISHVLGYNFLMDLALDMQLPNHKPNPELELLKTEVQRLKRQNEDLKLQLKTLMGKAGI